MIDAHFHLWQLDRPECTWPTSAEAPIHRDNLLPEFQEIAGSAGVRQAILVQSQENAPDTSWLLDQAGEASMVAAVVGWSDLLAPDAATNVHALAHSPWLKGLRPMVQDRQADWYDQPEFDAAVRAMADAGLRLDALVRVRHLESLVRLAARFPTLSIVIDHAAKPAIGERQGHSDWYEAIAPLAGRPNVFCKFSGLLTECPAGRGDGNLLAPYASSLLALFGAERLMWGSDWPVLNMAGSYLEWLQLAKALMPATAHPSVFGGTARKFYGLAEHSSDD